MGAHTIVNGQNDPGAAHRGVMVCFLHQLAARSAGEAGEVPCGVFLWRAHIESVDRARTTFGQCVHRRPSDALHTRALSHRASPFARQRLLFGRSPCGGGAVGAVFQCLPRQQPAYGAVAQRGDGIRQ